MKRIVLLIVVSLLAVSCSSKSLRSDTEIDGLTYAGGTKVIFHDNDTVKEGYLADNTMIDGVSVSSGLITFYENGQIESCYLGQNPLPIQGYQFKGKQVSVQHSVQDNSTFVQNWEGQIYLITFYESGKVKSGYLHYDTAVDGIKYKAGTFNEDTGEYNYQVVFYENGKVMSGTLAEDTVINDITWDAGTAVIYSEDGSLAGATLYSDTVIDGVNYPAMTIIEL